MAPESEASEPKEAHKEIWEELRRVRDRNHELANKVVVCMSEVKELEYQQRERWNEQNEQAKLLATLNTNVGHLLEAERGRFGRLVASITVIVTVVNLVMMLGFKMLGK